MSAAMRSVLRRSGGWRAITGGVKYTNHFFELTSNPPAHPPCPTDQPGIRELNREGTAAIGHVYLPATGGPRRTLVTRLRASSQSRRRRRRPAPGWLPDCILAVTP